MKDTLSGFCGFIGGITSYILGNPLDIECLLFVMSLDVFLGVLACFVNTKLTFNSTKMRMGLLRKILVITLVAFSIQLDSLCGTNGIIMKTVVWFFITNEFLSCVENAGKCGVKYPVVIKNSLEQLKGVVK